MSNERATERPRRREGEPFLPRKRSKPRITSGRIRNRRGAPRNFSNNTSGRRHRFRSEKAPFELAHVDAVIAGGHARLGETNRADSLAARTGSAGTIVARDEKITPRTSWAIDTVYRTGRSKKFPRLPSCICITEIKMERRFPPPVFP